MAAERRTRLVLRRDTGFRINWDDKSFTCKFFNGGVLFVGAVSVGNVGQFATDLLLDSLENEGMKPVKVGSIYHAAIEPMVGASEGAGPSGSGNKLLTSVEMFYVPQRNYMIIHFRAPVRMVGREQFVREFAAWIKERNFAQVVVLGSLATEERRDPHIGGSPFRYISSRHLDPTLLNKIKSVEQWNELDLMAVLQADGDCSDNDPILSLPGSGITRQLFEECEANDILFLGLLMFAAEGESNHQDAQALFQMANKVFEFQPNTSDPNQNEEGRKKKNKKVRFYYELPLDHVMF